MVNANATFLVAILLLAGLPFTVEARNRKKGKKGSKKKSAKVMKSVKKTKAAKSAKKIDLTVMARNLYLGADLSPFFDNPPGIDAIINEFVATDFAARSQALADEIYATKPDLIAVNEATIVDLGGVVIDFIPIILGQLTSLGLSYSVASKIDLTFVPIGEYSLSISNIILVNEDRDSLSIENNVAGYYENQFSIGDFSFVRGWCYVDALLNGFPFRFFSTHLEVSVPFQPVSEPNNFAQTEELLEIIKSTPRKRAVILGADLNATPDSRSYKALTKELNDVWEENAKGGKEGFTCCQSSDLNNIDDENFVRIDYILYRDSKKSKKGAKKSKGGKKVDVVLESAELVGAMPFQASQPRYASDHAGIVSSLNLEQ